MPRRTHVGKQQRKNRGRFVQKRLLRLEPLEVRAMLSGSPAQSPVVETFAESLFDPSPEEQELFEAINRLRMNPQAELSVLFSSLYPLVANDPHADAAIQAWGDPTSSEIAEEWAQLTPVAPLSWNISLAVAAEEHNSAMQAHDLQDHVLPGEATLGERITDAGYTDWLRVGENIMAYAKSVLHAYSSFAIDWNVFDRGHRMNIMDPGFTDIGVSILSDSLSSTGVGPLIVTTDFGSGGVSTLPASLLGVVYDDYDGDGLYDAGEGLDGVTISVTAQDGAVVETTTMTAGGYQIKLPDGVYTVTASGGALSRPIIVPGVEIDGENVKVDINLANVPVLAPIVDLNGTVTPGDGFEATYVEHDSPVSIVSPLLDIEDLDGDVLGMATVRIVDLYDTYGEMLDVDTSGTNLSAVFNPADGTLTIVGEAPISTYESVLQTLSYSNVFDVPTLGTRTIHVTVTDTDLAESAAAATLVHVMPEVIPDIVVERATGDEGDALPTPLRFTVSLSEPATRDITIAYATHGELAEASIDFVSVESAVTIPAGQTQTQIGIAILPDKWEEGDETLLLELGLVVDTTGVPLANVPKTPTIGTIVDNDVPTELGQIARYAEGDVALEQGRSLYRFTAMRDGPLGMEALLRSVPASNGEPAGAPAPAPLVFNVYESPWDTQSPPIAVGTVQESGAVRIDLDVLAGQTYLIEFLGPTDAAVDWRMANVIEQIPGGQRIVGSADDEKFVVDLSGEPRVQVDGLWLPLDPMLMGQLLLAGAGGDDTIEIVGSGQGENWRVDPDQGFVERDGERIELDGVQTVLIDAGWGDDVVHLLDTPGDDILTAGQGTATLSGPGVAIVVENAASILAEAVRGGDDIALLFDTASNDRAVISPMDAMIEGGGVSVQAVLFDTVVATAGAGGFDSIVLNDSADDDQFVAGAEFGAFLSGGGATVPAFVSRAFGFESLTARSVSGGDDSATLFDSRRNDVLRGDLDHVTLTDTSATYAIKLSSFEQLTVSAVSGGSDKAHLYVDVGAGESFTLDASGASLSGPTASLTASYFDKVLAETEGPSSAPASAASVADYLWMLSSPIDDDSNDEDEDDGLDLLIYWDI